jgi:hypothetical protein
MTREQWLYEMLNILRDDFLALGRVVPEKIRIGVGFPSSRALSKSSRTIGQCFSEKCSDDNTHEILISPLLADAVEVAGVLVHEAIHATVGVTEGHKGAFKRVAESIGLTGKMTATTVGPYLRVRLEEIIAEIGPYPHAALNPNMERKKEGTRLIKVECPNDGYTIRVTKKWLDIGFPVCPCGQEMGCPDE